MRIGIVVASFHKDIADAMLGEAEKAAEGHEVEVIRVPGSYEAPLAVKRLLQREDIDCVAVLGYIEKGETLHGEQMGLITTRLYKELELEAGKPVGMGVIGPGATLEQAKKRIGNGAKAVKAALKMC